MVDDVAVPDVRRELVSRWTSFWFDNVLADCTGSSRGDLFFCNLDWLLLVGSCDVKVVGVMERFGSRVVGVISSTLLGGPYCDL